MDFEWGLVSLIWERFVVLLFFIVLHFGLASDFGSSQFVYLTAIATATTTAYVVSSDASGYFLTPILDSYKFELTLKVFKGLCY
jgi:hypothetical protein